jgi:plasmid stability protein
MATLTIKNIPNELHHQLKQTAAQHHRSVNSEVITCLERALHAVTVDAQAFINRARDLRKKTFGHKLTDRKLEKAKNAGRS